MLASGKVGWKSLVKSQRVRQNGDLAQKKKDVQLREAGGDEGLRNPLRNAWAGAESPAATHRLGLI